ncbi:hypothetical protein HETIRDRAFT_438585 [Heterobasidion irregulare TC 32-1]|uniref:Uncharacterized protein n=1 Tax=Heterobasidion irregulare (strain TC 32-1) TaxID=747525 RepID=W4KLX0_HETIT|nr:uncharacterized protein HETIRDRAFT_438585 [Heterobasidion irregulare TC 32-1]ETW86061.1 hypothetical protein HETIRDRAFT_438585 [Heterobasidion irregulare TC 32-1]
MSDNHTLVHGTTVKTGIDSISSASRSKAKQTPQSSADPEQTNKRKRKAAADGAEPARPERKRRTNPRASDVAATRSIGPITSSVVEEEHEARRTVDDSIPIYLDKLIEKVQDLEALVEHQNKELRALKSQLSRMEKSHSENFHRLLKLYEDRQDAPPNAQQPRAPPPRTLGQFTPNYHSDRGGPNWQPPADDQSVYAFDGSPQRYAQRQSPADNHQHPNILEPSEPMRAPPHPFPHRGRGFGRGRGRGAFRQQPRQSPYHQDLAHAAPDTDYRAQPSRRGYGDSSHTPPRLPYSQYNGTWPA